MLLDNIKRSTLHRNTWHQSLFGYTIAWCWECSRNSWKKTQCFQYLCYKSVAIRCSRPKSL